jgi:hypothetical protein
VTEVLTRRTLILPLFHDMDDGQLGRVAGDLRSALLRHHPHPEPQLWN